MQKIHDRMKTDRSGNSRSDSTVPHCIDVPLDRPNSSSCSIERRLLARGGARASAAALAAASASASASEEAAAEAAAEAAEAAAAPAAAAEAEAEAGEARRACEEISGGGW